MKVMILSPHLDDEILSCSSFLQDVEHLDIKVLYFTSFHPGFPGGKNKEENHELCKTIYEMQRPDHKFHAVHFDLKTNHLDQVPQAQLIEMIETEVNHFQPDTVVVPFPSYNQDHRAIYEAALTAMRRHDQNHWVKCILVGEQPETFDTMRKDDGFKPTYFRPLNVEFKLDCFEIYQSQQRGHRSLDNVQTVAKLRGMQANMDYAEAFEVVRWIE